MKQYLLANQFRTQSAYRRTTLQTLKALVTCLHFICISNRTISSIHTFDKELSLHFTVHFKQISFQFTIPWRDLVIYNHLVLEERFQGLPSPFEFSCAYYIHVSFRHIYTVFPPKFLFLLKLLQISFSFKKIIRY